jgi:hypothetical protein
VSAPRGISLTAAVQHPPVAGLDRSLPESSLDSPAYARTLNGNNKTIMFPISAKRVNGKTTFEYVEIPEITYISWLKRCYELSGN